MQLRERNAGGAVEKYLSAPGVTNVTALWATIGADGLHFIATASSIYALHSAGHLMK